MKISINIAPNVKEVKIIRDALQETLPHPRTTVLYQDRELIEMMIKDLDRAISILEEHEEED